MQQLPGSRTGHGGAADSNQAPEVLNGRFPSGFGVMPDALGLLWDGGETLQVIFLRGFTLF